MQPWLICTFRSSRRPGSVSPVPVVVVASDSDGLKQEPSSPKWRARSTSHNLHLPDEVQLDKQEERRGSWGRSVSGSRQSSIVNCLLQDSHFPRNATLRRQKEVMHDLASSFFFNGKFFRPVNLENPKSLGEREMSVILEKMSRSWFARSAPGSGNYVEGPSKRGAPICPPLLIVCCFSNAFQAKYQWEVSWNEPAFNTGFPHHRLVEKFWIRMT